jgi:hypothetical protein
VGARQSASAREAASRDRDDDEPPNPHALDYWIAEGAVFIRFSEALATFGRASEAAGKPGAIAALARRWLTVPIENSIASKWPSTSSTGRSASTVERSDATGSASRGPSSTSITATISSRSSRRSITIAPPAPLYDGMIAWAQPEPATRRYVHQVGGYAITGHTGEHKLWFHYGREAQRQVDDDR